jgi:endonuclease/exonuclease/phosphatase family metal-dependent hydrolase
VLGDLQVQFDAPFMKTLKDLGMRSPLMERTDKRGWSAEEKIKGLPTRYPRQGMSGNPTAIDWILVNDNTAPYVHAVGLDKEPNRLHIGSDHIPVFIDLRP